MRKESTYPILFYSMKYLWSAIYFLTKRYAVMETIRYITEETIKCFEWKPCPSAIIIIIGRASAAMILTNQSHHQQVPVQMMIIWCQCFPNHTMTTNWTKYVNHVYVYSN